ncbi:hypothetical protein ACTWQF_31720 [Streptomyces sp. 8N114]|uniref:hypothetical protein n=1 Tax=Streptomyces sp. 8N114 TaxID=3457419 RepID=UPI003FD1D3B4
MFRPRKESDFRPDFRAESDRRTERRTDRSPKADLSADAERLRRRARFLRELNEAKELRERVHPRRSRAVRRRRQALRMRTFRW